MFNHCLRMTDRDRACRWVSSRIVVHQEYPAHPTRDRLQVMSDPDRMGSRAAENGCVSMTRGRALSPPRVHFAVGGQGWPFKLPPGALI
jgi:hypothetical protein